jgi:hypothetical protein
MAAQSAAGCSKPSTAVAAGQWWKNRAWLNFRLASL